MYDAYRSASSTNSRASALACLVLLLAGCFTATGAALAQPARFTETTAAAGLATQSGPSYGAAWGDFDGDTYPDLWLGNHAQPPTLLRNDGGGGFVDITDRIDDLAVFERADMHGAAWADFDRDGNEDLIILVGGQAGSRGFNLFLRNDGDRLANEAVARGVEYEEGRGRTPLWLDWNADGLLDVFLTNWKNSDGLAPTAPLSQRPDNTFVDDRLALGVATDGDNSVARLWRDATTGQLILVVQKRQGFEAAYEFDGEPWQNVLADLGLPGSSRVRDLLVFDYNGDNLDDFLLLRTSSGAEALQSDVLLEQRPDGSVVNVTEAAGLGGERACETGVAADFDNDGDTDLYLVCHIDELNVPNLYFDNVGGRFELDAQSGAEGSELGTGDSATIADYDRDGFPDLLVTNGRDIVEADADAPVQLFRNNGNGNHWLQLDLQGVISNNHGIGALVTVSAGGRVQQRVLDNGTLRFAQSHRLMHFGLGAATVAQSIQVVWPSGLVQTLDDVPADQRLVLREPVDAGANDAVLRLQGTAAAAGALVLEVEGIELTVAFAAGAAAADILAAAAQTVNDALPGRARVTSGVLVIRASAVASFTTADPGLSAITLQPGVNAPQTPLGSPATLLLLATLLVLLGTATGRRGTARVAPPA